jgi:DNA-binding SARP family transcriptional activator
LIARAPYRESGHRLLMETLAAHGNTAEALLVYDALRQRLRDELGAAPSAQTKDLHRRLLG